MDRLGDPGRQIEATFRFDRGAFRQVVDLQPTQQLVAVGPDLILDVVLEVAISSKIVAGCLQSTDFFQVLKAVFGHGPIGSAMPDGLLVQEDLLLRKLAEGHRPQPTVTHRISIGPLHGGLVVPDDTRFGSRRPNDNQDEQKSQGGKNASHDDIMLGALNHACHSIWPRVKPPNETSGRGAPAQPSRAAFRRDKAVPASHTAARGT